MHRLTYSPDAAAAYRKLQADLGARPVLVAVDRVLDQLERDPGHYSVRHTEFVSERWKGRRLWGVPVYPPDQDWLITWTQKEDGHPHVVTISRDWR